MLKPSQRRMQPVRPRNTRHDCVVVMTDSGTALVWPRSRQIRPSLPCRVSGTTEEHMRPDSGAPNYSTCLFPSSSLSAASSSSSSSSSGWATPWCVRRRDRNEHCDSLVHCQYQNTMSVTTLPQLRFLFSAVSCIADCLPCHQSREHWIARDPSTASPAPPQDRDLGHRSTRPRYKVISICTYLMMNDMGPHLTSVVCLATAPPRLRARHVPGLLVALSIIAAAL